MHRVIRVVAKQVTQQIDFGKDLLLGRSRTAAIAVLVVFILVQVNHAHGQAPTDASAEPNLVGTWQGTLEASRSPGIRTVLKISSADGALRGVMYRIDQDGSPIPVTLLSLQGNTVKFTVDSVTDPVAVTYEGRLSADGASIVGVWTHGSTTHTLNLMRVSGDAAWAIPPPPAATRLMAADATPTFAVATIKPASPDELGTRVYFQGQRVAARSTSLMNLISFAYGVHSEQIMGAPAWAATERYDIVAEPDVEGRPNDKQLKSMVQKLLVERYRLSLHHGSKVLPVYVLSIAKREPTLTESDPDGPSRRSLNMLGGLVLRNATIGDLASDLEADILDRPVVDRTGIAGKYDLTLKWTPDDWQFPNYGTMLRPPVDAATAPPDLFTAIQQQLGLRLESTKAPVDVLVIDHIERPSAN